MITSKDYLYKLIDEVSKEEIAEIMHFVKYLKIKKSEMFSGKLKNL